MRSRNGNPAGLTDVDIPDNGRWHPFQLAFILLNLPGLTDPTHPDRSHRHRRHRRSALVPHRRRQDRSLSGPGRLSLAMRRLQGEVGGDAGHAGVAVLMRYTLRLLTLQQFQRAAALICACEVIRREDAGNVGARSRSASACGWASAAPPTGLKIAAEAIKQDRDQEHAAARSAARAPRIN